MAEAAKSGNFMEWVGRRQERIDTITTRLAAEFRAAMAPYLSGSGQALHGIFWCLAPDTVSPDLLGTDGHPKLGLFLPDVHLPRRMWAGGELIFHGLFATGDVVEKTSTIENIALKAGSSGPLCFVTVRHHYRVEGELILDERQDIVYREPPKVLAGHPKPAQSEVRQRFESTSRRWVIMADPILLFRFSALTFNAHRIHFDYQYATKVEGYEGLVVHGPLQALLMLNLSIARLECLPRRFSYRGLAPLICGEAFAVELDCQSGSGIEAHVISAANVKTMSALIEQ